MWETGHRDLWKLDFPECAERALQHIKHHYTRESSSSIPGLGGPEELSTQIVEDLIFVHSSRNKAKNSRVPPALQELRSLELILKLYNELSVEKVPDTVSFSVFQVLFWRAVTDTQHLNTLSRLVSLAISMGSSLALDSAALWLQLQGVQTSCVQQIIKDLIMDYSGMSEDNQLSRLPKLSQHFTCIFISATVSIYKFPGPASKPQNKVFYEQLLPMLTSWILDDPHLCLLCLLRAQHVQSLVQPQRATLWTSPTKPNTHTPVPGLVRWATQGPLSNLDSVLPTPALTEKPSQAIADNYKNENKQEELLSLWSKLHLSILQMVTAFATVPGANQLEVITLVDMKNIVDELVAVVDSCQAAAGQELVETCLDRMVQVLQLTLATGAFRCSLADLKSICQSLPPTKLKTILESQHLSFNPPAMHNAS